MFQSDSLVYIALVHVRWPNKTVKQKKLSSNLCQRYDCWARVVAAFPVYLCLLHDNSVSSFQSVSICSIMSTELYVNCVSITQHHILYYIWWVVNFLHLFAKGNFINCQCNHTDRINDKNFHSPNNAQSPPTLQCFVFTN